MAALTILRAEGSFAVSIAGGEVLTAEQVIARVEADAVPCRYTERGGPVSVWVDSHIEPPEAIIVNTLDRGAKCMIVGSSKCRKSFFILQLALSFATGRDFLNWEIMATKTLLVNLEIPQKHARLRIQRMARALGIRGADLKNLTAIDVRGFDFDINDAAFTSYIRSNGFGVIILDPLYKVLRDGDENSAQDVKPYLAMFDRIAEDTGAAVVFTHHCAKGQPGERSTIDRGAGSGVLARDYDCGIYLNEHAEDGLLACQTIVRAYPPQEAFSIRWDENHFQADSTEAVVRTGMNGAKKDAPKLSSAFSIMATINTALRKTEAIDKLREGGFSRRGAQEAITELIALGKLQEKRTGFPAVKWVGIPGAMLQHLKEIEGE